MTAATLGGRHPRRASRTRTSADAFVGSLAVAGAKRDTACRGCPDSRGSSAARRGPPISRARLSGLVSDSIAFAVLQNGSPVAYWSARTAQDRFVQALAGSLGPPATG